MTDTGADGLLPIGTLSLRSGLSIAALRRYDAVGLLPAADVDPRTGYRSYRPDQVRTAHLVRLLRVLDVPVPTIAELLADPDPRTAWARLEEHWAQVERRVAEGRRIKAFLHRSLGGTEAAVFTVQVKDVPEQTVLGRRRVVAIPELSGHIGSTLGRLQEEAGRAQLPVAGPGVTLYYSKVDDETDGEVQVCLPVRPTPAVDPALLAEGTTVEQLPGGTVAWTTATGPAQARYPGILGAYDAVADWARAHGRLLSGPPRETVHGPDEIEVAWLLHEE